MDFRQIIPLHRALHQLDDRSTVLQLVDIRSILRPRIPTQVLVAVNNGERLEEAEELPDEVGEWRGLCKLELLKYHAPVHGVHPVLPRSTGVLAVGFDLHVVEDVFHLQCRRFVVGDPMDAYIENDKKEGFEFVRNLVNLARVEKLPGRDELPCALDSRRK